MATAAKKAQAATGPTSDGSQTVSFLQKVFSSIISAVVAAVIAGTLGFFHDQIYAQVYSLLQSGAISGDYELVTKEYNHTEPYGWIDFKASVTLKQGGPRVFGSETFEAREWRIFGYYRQPFLALSYENKDPASNGAGTYTLRRDIPYAFWGYWSGVECKAGAQAWGQCPVVLYRKDRPGEKEKYKDFLKQECIWIESKSPGSCSTGK